VVISIFFLIYFSLLFYFLVAFQNRTTFTNISQSLLYFPSPLSSCPESTDDIQIVLEGPQQQLVVEAGTLNALIKHLTSERTGKITTRCCFTLM